MMNIVLVEPDIPWNTGNIGRTCVGTKSALHLVGRLGFSLKDKYLKRAGLDYWQDLNLKTYSDWDEFERNIPENKEYYFFEKDGSKMFWEARFAPHSYLIFVSETKCFPQSIIEKYKNSFYKIPMKGPIRSLNLSTAVGIAIYEAIRQTRVVKE